MTRLNRRKVTVEMSKPELCPQCGREVIQMAFTDPGFIWYCKVCSVEVIAHHEPEFEAEQELLHPENCSQDVYNVWGRSQTQERRTDEQQTTHPKPYRPKSVYGLSPLSPSE